MATDLDDHVPAIAAGDPRAFAAWLAGAEGRLRASLKPLEEKLDVEVVAQDALLRFWQVAPRFVPDGKPNGSLRLVIRIARNCALDELRRARLAPRETAALERALVDAERVAMPVEPDPLLRRIIEICRGRLPSRPAAALDARLHSGGGESDAALADRVGMKLNTFLKNVGRARKLLKECLRRHQVDVESLLP